MPEPSQLAHCGAASSFLAVEPGPGIFYSDEVFGRVLGLRRRMKQDTMFDTRASFWRTALSKDLRDPGRCEGVVGGSCTILVTCLPEPQADA